MTRSPPTGPGPARDPQPPLRSARAPAADLDTLEIAALRERLRLSIERARSTQRTAPLEMLFGITVCVVLLSVYMGQLGDRIKDNILLSLQKDVLTRQLNDSLARMAMQATTDPLTGRANRRAVDDDELQRQQAQFERTRTPFSVLLLDIDHFKQINDQHGHGIGDEALKAFARRVAASLRPSDFLGRYGGEEFVVILPGTPLEQALHVAQRVCDAVPAQPLPASPRLPATVSIGMATCRPGDTARGVLEAADHAVYEAKRSGRNRVCASQAPIALQRQAAPDATQA